MDWLQDSDWWIPITEDYEYTVTVTALETFKNALAKLGIHLPRVEKIDPVQIRQAP